MGHIYPSLSLSASSSSSSSTNSEYNVLLSGRFLKQGIYSFFLKKTRYHYYYYHYYFEILIGAIMKVWKLRYFEIWYL